MITPEEREQEIRGEIERGGSVEVFVDVSAYNGDVAPLQWCLILRVLFPGSAGVYPVKVQIPDRGEGQFKWSEIRDVRIRF